MKEYMIYNVLEGDFWKKGLFARLPRVYESWLNIRLCKSHSYVISDEKPCMLTLIIKRHPRLNDKNIPNQSKDQWK